MAIIAERFDFIGSTLNNDYGNHPSPTFASIKVGVVVIDADGWCESLRGADSKTYTVFYKKLESRDSLKKVSSVSYDMQFSCIALWVSYLFGRCWVVGSISYGFL